MEKVLYKIPKENAQLLFGILTYYDMMIPKGNQGTACCDKTPLSIFFMLCFIALVILGYTVNGYCLIGIPFCWLISCCESYNKSATLKYTQHPLPLRMVDSNIN